jgi:hypothetical protein
MKELKKLFSALLEKGLYWEAKNIEVDTTFPEVYESRNDDDKLVGEDEIHHTTIHISIERMSLTVIRDKDIKTDSNEISAKDIVDALGDNRIDAIRRYRALKDCGLAEAKEAIDEIYFTRYPKPQ